MSPMPQVKEPAPKLVPMLKVESHKDAVPRHDPYDDLAYVDDARDNRILWDD